MSEVTKEEIIEEIKEGLKMYRAHKNEERDREYFMGWLKGVEHIAAKYLDVSFFELNEIEGKEEERSKEDDKDE